MKLIGSTKSKTTKYWNGETLPFLVISEVLLVQSNIVNHHYQQDSRTFYTFIPSKLLDQILDILPKTFIVFSSKF